MNQYANKNLTLNSQKLRKQMTPWERKLWYEFLKGYRLDFHRQKVVGKYIVDFYCARVKLAIELDGSQHYSSENMLNDMQRTDYLNSCGIKVLRFSNLDITKNFYGVCSRIDEVIKQIEVSN